MRTLKKTLCLVLALAMVLSLGVTSAFAVTADDFTDLKDSKHEEAVRVLTAIGVVSGNGDGTLTPKATLTRAQMAVLITKLMGGLGNKFIPSTSFTDVKGHYAERYIAFCEANGIVRGDGDGTYRPDAQVTGYELGVMLLSVIGYNMDYEVKDKDWQAVTYKYVTKIDLDAGLSLEYDYTAPIPRDDAFQLCFNTLTATMVDYGGNTSVSGPGFDFNITSDARDVARTGEGSTLNNYAGNDVNAPGLGYKQVCEQYYPRLTRSDVGTNGRDVFGRPGHTWFYGAQSIFAADTPVITFDKAMTEAEVFTAVGAAGINGRNIVMDEIWDNGILVNGNEFATVSATPGDLAVRKDTGFDSSVTITKGETGNTAGLGNGVNVELYATTPNHYIMVCYKEYLASVGAVIPANDTTGTKRAVGINNVTIDGDVWATAASHQFVTNSFAEGDDVLITVAGIPAVVQSVTAPTILENAEITAYTRAPGMSATTGGTTYKYSQTYSGVRNDGTASQYDPGYVLGARYNLYLDSHGNIIYDEVAVAANNYVYVLGVDPVVGGNVTGKYANVKYVDTEGKVTIAKVKTISGPVTGAVNDIKDTEGTTNQTLVAGKWYTVADDPTEGYVKLTLVAASSMTNGNPTQLDATVGNIPADATAGSINKVHPEISTGIVSNNKTIFVLKTADAPNPEKYEAYVGIESIPAYRDVTNNAYAVVPSGGYYAEVIYIDVSNATLAGAVNNKAVYLLTGVRTGWERVGNTTVYSYDAVVDGVKQTIWSTVGTGLNGSQPGLVRLTVNDAGYVTAVGAVPNTVVESTNVPMLYKELTLTVNTTKYLTTANTVVYHIDGNNVQTVTLSSLNGKTAATSVTVVKASALDDTITTVYVVGALSNT